MSFIVSLLDGWAVRLGLAAAAVGAFLFYSYDQRQIGAERAIAKVEKNNATVRQAAGNAARKSLDPGARGVLNPYYRD